MPLYFQLAMRVQVRQVLSVVAVHGWVLVPAAQEVVVHDLHAVRPSVFWYWEFPQSVHAETTPPKLNVPIEHFTHAVNPADLAT